MSDALVPNRRERRQWDQYVTEANAKNAEVEIGGQLLTIYPPSIDGLNALTAAEREGDISAALTALFGETNAAVVMDAAKGAPITALQALMKDVLRDLGLSNSPE